MAVSKRVEGLLFLPPVRLSYPHMFAKVDIRTPAQRKTNEQPNLWYTAQFIIDAKTLAAPEAKVKLNAVFGAIRKTALESFKDKAAGFMTKHIVGRQNPQGDKDETGIRSPIRDGTGKPGGAYGPGTYYFDTRSMYEYPCVDGHNRKVSTKDGGTEIFYSGCYVIVAVKPRAQPFAGNDSMKLDAVAVKFHSAGERLDSAVDPNDVFGPLDEAEEEPGSLQNLFSNLA